MKHQTRYLKYYTQVKEQIETDLRLLEIPYNYKWEINCFNNSMKDLKDTNREIEKLKKEMTNKHERRQRQLCTMR